ncbi:Uncharacterized protein FWK35_00027075 [Aphis craccivora]|uniref:Uncharacterized protein n=1 Tax=Aphis craccivora TaxID=307492 RepID=A0A6G0VTK4_APHCR|nr:Uncharacterized protein FWK35_00027075 [Aphis craccivora]
MKYEINGIQIQKLANPGITTTLKGYCSYESLVHDSIEFISLRVLFFVTLHQITLRQVHNKCVYSLVSTASIGYDNQLPPVTTISD